jgi:nitrate/TMAO reductase-like tetraheme cytochrome c subunit
MKKLFTLMVTILAITPAIAAKMPMPSDAPKSYESECASCHMAYPPGLLGEKSWQNVMSGLNKHFGTDASLDAKDQKEISSWLQKNAATKQKYNVVAPDNRITKTPWFIRDVWKRAGIKSAANCGACHTTAAEGIFSEKSISIPAK